MVKYDLIQNKKYKKIKKIKDIKTKKYSYNETINIIKKNSENIYTNTNNNLDGRLNSAIKENEFLNILVNRLKKYKNLKIDLPSKRYWYDIKINDIPINLKITNGGTDDAFNKIAIIYTLLGKEWSKLNLSFNEFSEIILNNKIKKKRNKKTEYHYLVVNKLTNNILLKSIIDINVYKSNSKNILQINWLNEFKNNNTTLQINYDNKIIELLLVIQKSIRQYIDSCKNIIDMDIYKLIKKN